MSSNKIKVYVLIVLDYNCSPILEAGKIVDSNSVSPSHVEEGKEPMEECIVSGINTRLHRYPYSIVWTPIPLIT